MERSRFIAKLIGPVCICGGLGMLFNTAVFKGMFEHAIHDHILIYLGGVLALSIGLAIVVLHNDWRWHWPLIVTVFGWVAVVGGIVRIVAPQLVETYAGQMIAQPNFFNVEGSIALLLGVLLSYFGYLEPPTLLPARSARGPSRRRRR